jgi:hypothetical protein
MRKETGSAVMIEISQFESRIMVYGGSPSFLSNGVPESFSPGGKVADVRS